MKYTLKQAAQLALDVQDACNLSGVVRSFATVTETLWEEARRLNQGTDFVNRHPISILFSSKIESLTHSGSVREFSQAYEACKFVAAYHEETAS